ncbi:YbaB/EbfC family nucleoid-associated protein [Sphaerisporangium fuscum]|uniref:YbaB/EbfC family nucleoid-associated protein n=1 Tax=Sphaerisporangium fuscum TaxID=2835868 RepID=UPI001BDD81CF|nr:YbaB/EbfC family nucleoid-associated protein [Sphaerisporangium fuscum]
MFDFDPVNFRVEDLDRVVRQSNEAVRRMTGAFDELRQIKGEGTAADGLIRAVVDGSGKIEQVEIGPRAMRLDSQTIAEAVTEAVREAQEDARRQNEQLLLAATEGESPRLDLDGLRRQFDAINDDFARTVDDIAYRDRDTYRDR